ncbi:MAG: response regulator [Planctomycetota bacterium]
MPASHDSQNLARPMSLDVPEQPSGPGPALVRSLGAVVIVDESAENREVLCTALQRRGLTTFAADDPASGLQLVRRHQPDVVVLDLDSRAPDRDAQAAAWPEDYVCETAATNGSLVLLGRWQAGDRQVPREQIIAKPYHFGPLIRKIEQLVAQHRLPQGTATHGLVVRDSRT